MTEEQAAAARVEHAEAKAPPNETESGSDTGPTTVEREAQLARVPFFEGLTPEALTMIAQVTTEEAYPYGTRIFQYGDPGDKLYIILEGKVRISREVGGMGEEALAVLGAGEIFGEMSLLDESPRSAGAIAHEKCRLLVITKDAFDDLLFLHKDLAYEVLWSCVRMLAARLRETNDKLTFLSTSGRF
ncbi:cAMP-binding protein [Labilithrix luteola]|uniref:cAMP-binding protein n=1 Tax=Labilithrix luteola TaxID=1391654 RepID=A0A0K1QG15_9BACT|nr:cyclic nucleotide-binding domain-containing protein [Labilithrix luteola]AKV04668.1 cAMP-binding protein [Labilithrix luteola]